MLRVGKCKLQALAAAATLAAPAIGLAQTTATWIGAVDGSWNVTSNWNAGPGLGYPGQGGAAVLPNPAPSQNFDISITLPTGFGTTLSSISFLETGSFGYSIVGAGSATIGAAAGVNGTLNVAAGGTGSITASIATPSNVNLFKTGGGTLILVGTNAFGTATGLQVTSGILQANASASLTGLTAVTTSGDGQFILNNSSITGSAFGGLGSNPTGGAVRSLAGNNTWNGSWFVLAPTSVGVDSGTLNLTGLVFDSAQTSANGLTKVGNGALSVGATFLNGPMNVNAGRVILKQNGTNSGTSRVGNLTIAGGARLDINDNDLIVTNGNLAAVTAQIKSGLENGGNYDWVGPGIMSSRANAQNTTQGAVLYGIGVLRNNLLDFGGSDDPVYTSFSGQTLVKNEVLVKYTYMGDTDLSGTIDGTDYVLTDDGFLNSKSGWAHGDFDYSGSVDGTDYVLLDYSFLNQSGPALALTMLNDHAQQFGDVYIQGMAALGVTVVPEPGSAALLLGMGLAGMAGRRRSRLKK